MSIARTNPTIINSIERIGSVVVALLLLFRILFDTSLNFVMLTAITLSAVYYLWFGFFIFTNAIPLDIIDRRKRAAFTPFVITSSILMGVVYSVCMISILFAFNFYPHMQFMLWFAFILILSSGGFLFTYHKIQPGESTFIKQFIRRSAIFGAFILFLLLIPVEKRLEVLYRKHPGFIQAYKEYRQNPDLHENIDKLREERSKFR
jgi:hypothetical protein